MKINKILGLSMVSVIAAHGLYGVEKEQLGNVKVTANKVEENVQEIPQSITVIDKEVLEERGIDTVGKVIEEIPNMAISDRKVFGSPVNFRGLNSSVFTYSNPVVIYINGVPIVNSSSYKASLSNVKRVEVLRGPQGTLYGKDAIGGVINIVTEDAPEELSGLIGVEYGDNNFKKTSLNINSPIIDKKLFAGFSGELKSDDGWIKNNYNNDEKAAKDESSVFSGYLKYLPSDSLSVKLGLHKSKHEDHHLDGGRFDSNVDISDINRKDAEEGRWDVDSKEIKDDSYTSLAIRHSGESFNIDWVSTVRDTKIDGKQDADYTDAANLLGYDQGSVRDTETNTHELRASSNGSDIKWVAGLYAENEEAKYEPYYLNTIYYGALYYANANSVTKSNTEAVFGQVMVPVTNNIELTVGGRQQEIKKEIDLSFTSTHGGTPMSNFPMKDDKKWSVFIPKMAVAYTEFENVTPFLSFSKGYMPGGYNFFPASSDVDSNIFQPQQSINYEVGIKGVGDDFVYTASIFYMNIEDIHYYKSVGNNWYTDNADKAHSTGIEVEGQYFISDTFDISGSLGLIDAVYDNYEANSTLSFDGEKIENIPSHTANLTLNYKNNGFYSMLNVKNTGEIVFFDNKNKKFITDSGHTILNVKAGYKFSNWDIYGYVNNITDEDYVASFMSRDDMTVAQFNDPRFVAFGANYKF